MEQRAEFTRSDGSIVSYLTRPLPDGATLIAFLDITATRRVQKALHERAEAVEAADRLKTEFVQNVSVQLRDPLQAIQGFAQVLQQRMTGPLNDRQQEQIDMVVMAAGQLGRLIDNILDLAMIEAGAVDLQRSTIHVPQLLAEAAAHAAISAKDTEVPIRVECGADVGMLNADEKRLRQILFNLLSNAQHHTDRGDTITLSAVREGDGVRITVADTGAGMAAATQAAAFDNFATGDGRGAGLGLALVRSFVELHGGWVKLQSAPGRGTAVHCFFPMDAGLAAAPILDLRASMRASA
jgi:signal transduction histidine kinase